MRDAYFYRRLCVLLLLLFCPLLTQASFNKSLWVIWQVNNPLSTETIDHQLWAQFLQKNLVQSPDGIHRIDYARLQEADKAALESYLQYLSTIDIDRYNRREQLAFWLNMYNALMLNTIAEYYPVKSSKMINISPGLFSVGPWGANLIRVKGHHLTLDEIHNKIIRPIWNDPRTHYALNNGAIGAPNLQPQPYRGDDIEVQLNQAALSYVNALRAVQVIEGSLVVSKVYKWYMDDFGGNEQTIIGHIHNFAQEPLRSQLKHINNISTYVYNWHLNGL
ncbi:MAG: DUF547 domain-containing protein [Legionellaceae bacterium]|nr:DUF547 domain-containing protein [Legionellaceae bacterium]